MVGKALIDKAFSFAGHSDEARLLLIERMQENTPVAIAAWYFGNRHPGGAIRNVVAHMPAEFSRETHAVTAVAWRCQ